MSKKWIVHGTEYYEKDTQFKVNAPTEELAIVAAEAIVSAKARRDKKRGSFSLDWAELIDLENSRFDTEEDTKRIHADLLKLISSKPKAKEEEKIQ
jgi:hypothetical protein|tara:strand:+ start:464 stop:751 length:288 start_codon:yes stop_codon:yes gene_type:complete